MGSSKENKKKETVAETKPTDLEKDNLFGQVKQIKQTYYKVRIKKYGILHAKRAGSQHDQKNYLTTYSEKGNKTEEIHFGVDRSCYKHTYNEKGTEKKFFNYDSSGTVNSSAIQKLSETGKVLESTHYDKDNKVTSGSVWEYDEKDNNIEFCSTKADGTKENHIKMFYDEKGHKIEQKTFKPDGSLNKWTTFINNENGHAIVSTELNQDGSVINTKTDTYEYNSVGRMIGHNGSRFNFDLSLETYQFEKDKQGNWIRKIEFVNKVPVAVYIREINYYGSEKSKEMDINIVSVGDLWIVSLDGLLPDEGEEEEEEFDDDDDFDEEPRKKAIPPVALTPAQAQWLSETGKGIEFSPFGYYVIMNNEIPSEISFTSHTIEVIVLMKELIENMGATLVHSAKTTYGYTKRLLNYTLSFPEKEYLLHVFQINEDDMKEWILPDCVEERIDSLYHKIYYGPIKLFQPADASGKRNKEFERNLEYYMEMCEFEEIPEKPEIYMIEVLGNNFHLKSHPVDDSFNIANLDRNYGYGFEKFHNELMQRFQTESKGLVLFHGEPGTGKTYYIRHLLRSMANNNKIVIYMPPNMVDHLLEPSFMTFISQQVNIYSQQKKFCVLLIEDAEPLLAARNSDTRIQGVTNLLNMTDGLLNDMLNLQIICTFNVGLKKLDKALLRPGRLIARKEFKAMSELDANILAQQLGVKHHFTKPATLSEVYALVKNKNTLIHDVDDLGADVSE